MTYPIQPTGLHVRTVWPEWEQRHHAALAGRRSIHYTWFGGELYSLAVNHMSVPAGYYSITLAVFQYHFWLHIHYSSLLDAPLRDARIADYQERLEAYIVMSVL